MMEDDPMIPDERNETVSWPLAVSICGLLFMAIMMSGCAQSKQGQGADRTFNNYGIVIENVEMGTGTGPLVEKVGETVTHTGDSSATSQPSADHGNATADNKPDIRPNIEVPLVP